MRIWGTRSASVEDEEVGREVELRAQGWRLTFLCSGIHVGSFSETICSDAKRRVSVPRRMRIRWSSIEFAEGDVKESSTKEGSRRESNESRREGFEADFSSGIEGSKSEAIVLYNFEGSGCWRGLGGGGRLGGKEGVSSKLEVKQRGGLSLLLVR